MGSKVKGEKLNKFGMSGANSQKIREQKTLPQISEQRLYNIIAVSYTHLTLPTKRIV